MWFLSYCGDSSLRDYCIVGEVIMALKCSEFSSLTGAFNSWNAGESNFYFQGFRNLNPVWKGYYWNSWEGSNIFGEKLQVCRSRFLVRLIGRQDKTSYIEIIFLILKFGNLPLTRVLIHFGIFMVLQWCLEVFFVSWLSYLDEAIFKK